MSSPSWFSSWRHTPPFLLTLFLHSQLAAALFDIAISPAIQDPLINPPRTACPVMQNGATYNTFPWTHHPVCVHAVLPNSEGAGLGKHQDFCVYTNSVFNNGRGISLVTTPETAAELNDEQYASYFEELEGPELYDMRESEGKGLGLFAKTEIAAGDIIIWKSPALIVSKDALNTPSKQRRHLLLQTAVDQLPEKTRAMLLGLAKNRGGFEIDDIIQTNAAGVKVWDSTSHLAIVPEAARVNHACRPNAYYRFDDYTLTWDVFALKDIEPGEELTFNYGFSTQPHDVRRQKIEQTFGFKCTCSLCSSNATALSASDERLQKIADIKAVLPTAPDDIPKFIGLLPNLIALLDEEDLHTETPMYEEILAYTWSSFGVEDRAKYWAGRARKHWEVLAGNGSFEVKRTGDLERDVKSHGTWMNWEGDPWEGEGQGHPWGDDGSGHEHNHSHAHDA